MSVSRNAKDMGRNISVHQPINSDYHEYAISLIYDSLSVLLPSGGGGYLDLSSDGDVPFCPKNWYP